MLGLGKVRVWERSKMKAPRQVIPELAIPNKVILLEKVRMQQRYSWPTEMAAPKV